MQLQANNRKFGNYAFIIFVVFCVQFTELKVDVVKIAEILLLILTPFIYQRKINKWILLIATFFFVWFVVSILLNPFRDFYLLKNVSILKQPYFITVGRFLELIACINLVALVNNFFKDKSFSQIRFFLRNIFFLSCAFLFFNLIVYVLNYSGFISETRLVYENFRLRGWFSEGGPYGLMLSFTFCLSFFYKHRYNNILRAIIVLTIIFIARSKAGMLLILVWYTLLYYKKLYKKLRELNIAIIVIGVIITSIIFVKISHKYIYAINNVRQEMKERPTDVNLVMGRISGLFIFPEMIVDYPLFGIGLGNYPIMRNNPEYLDFIPPSPVGKTDAHGFGGIIQVLVDGGVVMLLFFLMIFFNFYRVLKKNNSHLKIFLYIFLCLFMFGVQIYFLYPWVLLGTLISLSNKVDEKYIN